MAWWIWLATALGLIALTRLAPVTALLLLGRREEGQVLAGFVPGCLVLISRLMRDDRVPRRRKLLLAALVGYLALPFDLVPDFIRVAGQLDDVLVVAFVLRPVPPFSWRSTRISGSFARSLWPSRTTNSSRRRTTTYKADTSQGGLRADGGTPTLPVPRPPALAPHLIEYLHPPAMCNRTTQAERESGQRPEE